MTTRELMRKAVWQPLGKAQMLAMNCSHIPEVLLAGARGGGKTLTLIMLFLQHVGKGYGAGWSGVIFRITHKALKDIKKQAREWIPKIYPDAQYNKTDATWTFPEGETLTFSQFATEDDYWTWHGQELPFIGWEELTAWPDDSCYKSMFSCNRSSKPGVPKIIRATTNPYGPGKHWVKERWSVPSMYFKVQKDLRDEDGGILPPRLALDFDTHDNTALHSNDPTYLQKIRASASNPEMLKAWLEGDWDAAAGGLFDEDYDPSKHIISPFTLLSTQWTLYHAFDWGSAAPYSYGIYAKCTEENTHPQTGQKFIRGDIIRIREDYGWNGKPNKGSKLNPEQQAQRFKELQETWGLRGRVRPGPAGADLFSTARGPSMNTKYANKNIRFTPAYVKAGSRVAGYQEIRTRLANAKAEERTEPGLFFFSGRNPHLLRVLVGAPPDPKNPDDVLDTYEDHPLDELRYAVFSGQKTSRQIPV